MEYLTIVSATALGYWTFKAATYPTSKIRTRMPNIKTKRVQIFPVIRFYAFGRVFHFHHWMNLSLLLGLSMFVSGGILGFMFTKGVLLGGIIQGLRLPKGHRALIYRDFSTDRLTSVSKK